MHIWRLDTPISTDQIAWRNWVQTLQALNSHLEQYYFAQFYLKILFDTLCGAIITWGMSNFA